MRTKTSVKFVINGREYGSLDEVPEADRKLIAATQSAMASPHPSTFKTERVQIQTTNGVTKYTVNGREYTSLDEVPETDRQLIEVARQRLKNAGSGESGSSDVTMTDQKSEFFVMGGSGRQVWKFKPSLTTLLWLLLGLAAAIIIAGLILKGMGK